MASDLDAPGAGLRPLADLEGYEVAEGYVDVRGFDLWDEQGQVIGEVDDLLVDPASGWARYLVVEVDEEAVAGMTNVEEVRVPVEAVTILEAEDAVRLERPIGLFAPGLVSPTGADLSAGARGLERANRETAHGGRPRTPRSDPAPGRPGLVIEPAPGGDIVGTERTRPAPVPPGDRPREPAGPGEPPASEPEAALRVRRRRV